MDLPLKPLFVRNTIIGRNKGTLNQKLLPFENPQTDTCIILAQVDRIWKNEVSTKGRITTLEEGQFININCLLDSGCTHSVIDAGYVKAKRIQTHTLPSPSTIYNADGTEQKEQATDYVDVNLRVWGHEERIRLIVANLGKHDLYLGHDWLQYHDPTINWKKGTVTFNQCPSSCEARMTAIVLDEITQDTYITVRSVHGKERNVSPEDLPPYLRPFIKVFSKEEFDELPPKRPWDYMIELHPDFKGNTAKAYPMIQKEDNKLGLFIEEHLKSGRIRPSKSPYAAPIFFIKKKDGSLQLIQDYRKLNQHTVKNKYPIPLISELIDKVKHAKWFTKLDVRWGYNNVRIREGDEHKAAFLTNKGLFEPLVMFFGLCNSPGTFQNMMNDIFKDKILQNLITIYLDDILIFADSKEELRHKTIQVMQKLQDNKLYLKLEKCQFEQQSVEFLGTVIENGTITMDPGKVKAVKEWKTPTNKKGIQSFLGFCNFYRRFIKDYARIAKPLTTLTGDIPFKWEQNQENAFKKLITALTTAPMLQLPTDQGKFRIETDASNYAIGGVLSQEQENKWHLIAFLSKTMNPAERNRSEE